jgi:hypothetical protein
LLNPSVTVYKNLTIGLKKITNRISQGAEVSLVRDATSGYNCQPMTFWVSIDG